MLGVRVDAPSWSVTEHREEPDGGAEREEQRERMQVPTHRNTVAAAPRSAPQDQAEEVFCALLLRVAQALGRRPSSGTLARRAFPQAAAGRRQRSLFPLAPRPVADAHATILPLAPAPAPRAFPRAGAAARLPCWAPAIVIIRARVQTPRPPLPTRDLARIRRTRRHPDRTQPDYAVLRVLARSCSGSWTGSSPR